MRYSDGEKYDKQMDNLYIKLWYEIVEYYLKLYLPEKGLVLDAGGGTGEWSIRVARINKNLRIINCDISKGMLERAQEKIEKLNLHERIENQVCDIMNFPYRDNQFDFVMCLGDSLSFCKDTERAFGELVRVTKPSGRIHISVNTFWGNFVGMIGRGPEQNFYFEDVMKYYETRIIHQNRKSMECRSFSVEELEEMGGRYGLKILKEFAAPVFPVYAEWLKDESKLRKIKEIQYKHCEDRNLLNFGNHINIIYEK